MNRIKYVDTLKFVAIFSIVLLHIASIWPKTCFLGHPFNDIREFVRFGVPLFLMITGMLTLNKEIDLEVFFKKKFVRIVYPLVFFLVVAYVLGVYKNVLTTFWYCWMIIGIYMAIPVINIFIKHAGEKDLEYFIAVFLFASLIYTIARFLNIKMAFDLDFFMGPVSYLILGYYLSRKQFNLSANKIILISLIAFILISILKVNFNIRLQMNTNIVVLSFLNLDLMQIIQTVSVFMFFKSLYESSSGIFARINAILERDRINGVFLSISRSSYGIYLLHMILFKGYFTPFFENYHMTGFQTFISIWIVATALLVISWIVILLLGKIPYVNRISGYY